VGTTWGQGFRNDVVGTKKVAEQAAAAKRTCRRGLPSDPALCSNFLPALSASPLDGGLRVVAFELSRGKSR